MTWLTKGVSTRVLLTKQIVGSLLIFDLLLSSCLPLIVYAETTAETVPVSAVVSGEGKQVNTENRSIATSPEITTVNGDSQKTTTPIPVQDVGVDSSPVLSKGQADSSVVEKNEPKSALADTSSYIVPQRRTDVNVTAPKNKIEPDLTTGAMKYSYNFDLPNGRNGQTPSLGLGYSSQNNSNSSLYGYGWADNLPYIERLSKHGVDRLYSDNYFGSSIGGELASTSATTYVPLVESGDFTTYSFSGNVWTMTDNKGTVYTFGADTNSRLDNSVNPNQIARWYITKEVDANGNTINYFYTKDTHQIYPDKISYTNNGGLAGVYEVWFEKELRQDNFTSYQTQFPVQSNYRISKVKVLANNQEIRVYNLSYTQSAENLRSLLTVISLTATDDRTRIATTLPATKFTYSSSKTAFQEEPTYGLPAALIQEEYSYDDNGTRLADINGDGYQDFVLSQGGTDGVINKSNIWLNTGAGWVDSSTWAPPAAFVQTNVAPYQPVIARGVQVVDLNGDGLADFVESGYFPPYSPTVVKNIYLNNGRTIVKSGADTSTSSLPFFFRWNLTVTQERSGDLGSRLADVNGDGLIDIITNDSDTGVAQTYINNGGRFLLSDKFLAPFSFTAPHPRWSDADVYVDRGTRVIDFNGDGLPDIIMEIGGVLNQLYLNNGSAFIPTTDNIYGTSTIKISSGSPGWEDQGVRLLDYNNDGFTDVAVSTTTNNQNSVSVYLNNGKTFALSSGALPLSFLVSATSSSKLDSGTIMADINGDGLEDQVRGYKKVGIPPEMITRLDFKTFINTGNRPDILTSVSESAGATINVNYKPSTWYKNSDNTLANPKSPLILNTVSAIGVNDGLGNVATTTYFYSNGQFWFNDSVHRRFSGFGKVSTTDPSGKSSISYFHQGDSLATSTGERVDHWAIQGLPYRTELWSGDNRKLNQSTILYSYNPRPFSGFKSEFDTPYFVAPIEVSGSIFDSTSTAITNFATSGYDATTGNLLATSVTPDSDLNSDGGLVGLGPKTIITKYKYQGPFPGLLTEEGKYDEADNNLALSQIDYDSRGNPINQRSLIGGIANFASTTAIYNSYGQVVKRVDALGNATQYTYDPSFVYPRYIDNALNHHISYVGYDYAANKPVNTIDANGQTWQVDLDGLGRPVNERIPSLTSTGVIANVNYTYNDTVMPRTVVKRSYRAPGDYTETITYLNGLGQKVKEESSGETAGESVVKTYGYNNLGQLVTETLPYFSSDIPSASLNTNYIYDEVGRPKSIATSLGTNTYSYQGYQSTVIDALNHRHDFIKDGFGNLVSVKEYNNGQVYTTSYEYDRLGNLINLIDAAGNTRSLTYDKLGRRLTITDLHSPMDQTFGLYSFTYDTNGNLIKKVDPNNQTVNYTYDKLGRPLTEDFPGTTGVDIVYTYDNCLVGIGRLCKVAVNNTATTAFSYNSRGGVVNEAKAIAGGGVFGLNYTYDSLDNVTSYIVGTPSTTVAFAYNSRNLIKRVDVGINGATSTYASNIGYTPQGSIKNILMGNTASTTYIYDSAKRYRLINKLTTLGAVTIQNLNYNYDAIGNITNLSDSASASNKKSVTYSYDDLYRLTSAAYTNTPTGSPYQETYTYDPIGNITSRSGKGDYYYEGTNYANPHALTKIANGPSVTTYTYDNNGNQIKAGSWNLTYNYNNQPIRIAGGSNITNYAYDYDGERLSYITGNTTGTTTYFYPNKFLNLALGTSTYHVFLGNNLLATIERKGSTTNTYYISTDHLGGSSVITNTNKKVVETSDYYPYGNLRVDDRTSTFREQRKFTGHEQDYATGFTYMGARYYNGNLGRFVSQDPVFWSLEPKFLSDPQQLNSYSYARNNPIVYVDPNGESISTFTQGFGSSIRSQAATIIAALRLAGISLTAGSSPVVSLGMAGAYSILNHYYSGSSGVSSLTGNCALPGKGPLETIKEKSKTWDGRHYLLGYGAGELATGVLITAVTGGGGAFAESFRGARVGREIVGGLNLTNSGGKLFQVGQRVEGFGFVAKKEGGVISGFTKHGYERLVGRNMTVDAIQNTVSKPSIVFNQANNTRYYLNEEAAVVLNEAGKVVTTYSKNEFYPKVTDLLDVLRLEK